MAARLLKLIHFVALAGFAGGLGAALLLADGAGGAAPAALAAARSGVAQLAAALIVPSLVVLVLSGMLLVVARPALIGARWVWAKAVLTVALGGLTLVQVAPAMQRLAALTNDAALGEPSAAAIQSALHDESWGGLAVLALSLIALALAVWRPRLGARHND
jgi:hypothetical protein